MKKAINQKVNQVSNLNFAVVITRRKKTYQFNYESRSEAMEEFIKFIANESHFSSLLGTKTIVGLWETFENGETICRRQLTMVGFY